MYKWGLYSLPVQPRTKSSVQPRSEAFPFWSFSNPGLYGVQTFGASVVSRENFPFRRAITTGRRGRTLPFPCTRRGRRPDRSRRARRAPAGERRAGRGRRSVRVTKDLVTRERERAAVGCIASAGGAEPWFPCTRRPPAARSGTRRGTRGQNRQEGQERAGTPNRHRVDREGQLGRGVKTGKRSRSDGIPGSISKLPRTFCPSVKGESQITQTRSLNPRFLNAVFESQTVPSEESTLITMKSAVRASLRPGIQPHLSFTVHSHSEPLNPASLSS